MKKLISILVTSVILTTSTAFAVDYGAELKNMPEHTYEQTFTDVPASHWAFNYIAELVNDNVLSGYPDGKFRPENNVSRAEFAKIMITASGIKAVPTTVSSFSDVDINEWYCPYIESAKEFLTGYQYSGYAMYLPDKIAIREDIAVALVKLKGYDVSVADLGMLKSMFSDYDSISEAAKRYVAVAVERGLVSGYDDGTFKGQQSITRAEAATLIWRANQYGSDNKVMGSETTPVPTETPNTTTTVKPTTAPVAESTVKTETKPYIMKKLASANVENSDLMTMDNSNNIYYVDGKTIYKLNTSNGSKKEFMDLSGLSLQKTEKQDVEVEEEITETVETGEFEDVEEEVTETVTDEETGEEKEITKTVTKKVPITKEETKTITKTVAKDVVVEEYSEFEPYQIKYDMGINKLFLCGGFTVLEQPFKGKEDVKYNVLYDISSGKGNAVEKDISGGDFFYGITLDTDRIIIYTYNFGNYEYELNTNNGTQSEFCYNGYDSKRKIWVKSGSNLYRLCTYGGKTLQKYNFTTGTYNTVTKINSDSFGIKGNSFYFWYNNKITKLSLSDGKTEELNINTTNFDVEFSDMGNLEEIYQLMFIVNDDKIIFYDGNMKAFRILEKNK